MSDSDEVVANCDFGSILAKARKTQNYTVDEINEQLKIPSQIIIALEANDLGALPIPTYTQGYIRNYAKFLEISEDEVIALYSRAVPNDDEIELKPRSNLKVESNRQALLIKLVTGFLAVGAIATVMIGIFQYYQEKADDMGNEFELKESEFTGNSLDSPGLKKLNIQQNARMTADGELIVENSNAILPLEDELNAKSADDEKAAELAEKSREQDILEINAENGSWVEVRDANNVRLFYNMLPEGGYKILFGQAPFRVSLGNAKTTQLVINDLEVDLTKHIRSNNTVRFKVSSEKQNVIINR